MAITKEQALTTATVHYVPASNARCYVYRRNGQTKTWKTRPTEWAFPVKYGLREYNTVTQAHAPNRIFMPQDCPACHGSKP